jgi:hypothetical protein
MAVECIDKCPNFNECISRIKSSHPGVSHYVVEGMRDWARESYRCSGPIGAIEVVGRHFPKVLSALGKETTKAVIVVACPIEDRQV